MKSSQSLSINSGNAQSNIVPFQVNRRVAPARFWERLWAGLFNLLLPNSEPQIKQIPTAQNPEAYQVYDPVTGQTKVFGTELETRIWLDQRFYDNRKNL
jgi:hypothetical protein